MQQRRQLYPLDHLRFFAASVVFAHHFRQPDEPDIGTGIVSFIADSWIRWGSNGVSLFLVLSGFLFVVICGDRQIHYGRFLTNRALRIFPLLIVVMLLLMTAKRDTWSADDLLQFVLLQMNGGHPMTGWGNDILPFGVTWTIAVEFQFYLLFPVLLVIMRRTSAEDPNEGLKSLLWMIAAMVLIRLFLAFIKGPDIYYNAYHTMLSRLDQFLIGMIAGRHFLSMTISKRMGIGLLLTGIVLLTIDVTNHQVNYYRVAVGLTAEALAWSLVIIGYTVIVTGTGAISRGLSWLGNLTFSLYLLHFFIAGVLLSRALEHGLDTGHPTLNFCLFAYVPTLALCVVTYLGIERPFLRLKVNYFKQSH